MTYKDLKIKLATNDITFTQLVKADGRSYSYLHREATRNNQKVLEHLSLMIDDMVNYAKAQ